MRTRRGCPRGTKAHDKIKMAAVPGVDDRAVNPDCAAEGVCPSLFQQAVHVLPDGIARNRPINDRVAKTKTLAGHPRPTREGAFEPVVLAIDAERDDEHVRGDRV
jgi:hypothetical protein